MRRNRGKDPVKGWEFLDKERERLGREYPDITEGRGCPNPTEGRLLSPEYIKQCEKTMRRFAYGMLMMALGLIIHCVSHFL